MRSTHRIRTLAVLACAATLLIAAAVTVSAQPDPMPPGKFGPGWGPGWGPGPGAGFGHGRLMQAREHLFAAIEKLDLTDAQKTKLRALRRQAVGILMPKKQAVIEARMDLADLMAQDKVDAAAARKANEKLMHARDELQAATFDLKLQARDVLTPEQLKQMREFKHPGKKVRIEKEKRLGFEY